MSNPKAIELDPRWAEKDWEDQAAKKWTEGNKWREPEEKEDWKEKEWTKDSWKKDQWKKEWSKDEWKPKEEWKSKSSGWEE
eukprot:1693883-Karenia_brevis.AAC.1